ncbi:MAG: hypothetical protein L0Z62_16830 [Gemmataceae bacterium]|nr:hypothetical protein [Gemmataceae bacterium]
MPPPDVVLEALGYGLLLPAAVTAATLMLAPWLGIRHAAVAERSAGALALGASFAIGFVVLEGSQVARTNPWFWLPFLALIAGGLGLVDLLPSFPSRGRWGVRALVAVVAAWLLVPSFLEPFRPQRPVGVAASIFILWALLEPLAERQPGGWFPLLLSLVALAGSVVLQESGNSRFAQLLSLLAGALGGCALVSWWYPHRSLLRGMIPGFAVLLPGLLFLGYFSADMPLVNFLLVMAAPLALWLSVLGPVDKMKPRWRILIQAVAVLVPVGLAVALTLTAPE